MTESFSREKLRHAPQNRKKVDEKSFVAFLLCDPGWYVQRTYDVQNEWEENTHMHPFILSGGIPYVVSKHHIQPE